MPEEVKKGPNFIELLRMLNFDKLKTLLMLGVFATLFFVMSMWSGVAFSDWRQVWIENIAFSVIIFCAAMMAFVILRFYITNEFPNKPSGETDQGTLGWFRWSRRNTTENTEKQNA